MLRRPAPLAAPDLPTMPATTAHAGAPRGAPSWHQIATRLGWRRTAAADAGGLCASRAAFIAALADLPAPDTRALCQLLLHAGTAAELWHLRPEVYRTLALHHSQAEAEKRLGAISAMPDGLRASGYQRPR